MMNFLGWLRKQVAPFSYVSFSEAGDPVRTPADYRGFSEEGYRKNAIAFRCISLISDAVAAIPWVLYRVEKDGMKTEVGSHPVLGLLNRPNPAETSAFFQRKAISYYLISGNSYIQAVGANGDRQPRELYALEPGKMKVIPGKGGVPMAFEYRPQHETITFPVSKLGDSPILHLKTFNPSTVWYGMSPMEAVALGIDTLNSGALWNLKLIQNGSKPSLVFKVEGNVNEVQFERLRKDIQEKHAGPWKAGLPIVARQFDVKPISWTPLEMDWLNSKKTSTADVGLAFGVPGQLLGQQDQTYENQKEARLAFYQDTVIPLKKMLGENLTYWLLPAYGEERLELGIDEDAIDALEPVRETRWKRAQESDFISINERREMVGYGKYEPTEDPGDKILVTASLVPLDYAAADVSDERVTDTEDQTGAGDTEEAPQDEAEDQDQEKSLEAHSFKASPDKRYWLERDRKKLARARALESKAVALFHRERDLIIERIKDVVADLRELVITNVVTEMGDDWERTMKAELTETARFFGKELIDELGKSVVGGHSAKAADDIFEFAISRFLNSRIKQAREKMSKTTVRRLMKAIRDAEERDDDGHLVEVEIASTVRKAYDSWSEKRAQSMSRTETHVAAEEGTLEAAKALKIPGLKKEWIAVSDDRVRDSHEKVSGTVIDVDEKFRVDTKNGSEEMSGPGDKDASPANLVNCRCVLKYLTQD